MKIKNFGKIYLQPTTFQKKLELRNNPIERSKLEKNRDFPQITKHLKFTETTLNFTTTTT
jgi:hypothetical protein